MPLSFDPQKKRSHRQWYKPLPPKKVYSRSLDMNPAYSEAMAEMIRSLPWDWYCTLTFGSLLVNAQLADRKYRRWINHINREVLGSHYKQGIPWIRATEFQRSGRIHYHALLGNVQALRRLSWMDYWEKGWPELKMESFKTNTGRVLTSYEVPPDGCGYARIWPYRSTGGAAHYLTKYLLKGGVIDLYLPTGTPDRSPGLK